MRGTFFLIFISFVKKGKTRGKLEVISWGRAKPRLDHEKQLKQQNREKWTSESETLSGSKERQLTYAPGAWYYRIRRRYVISISLRCLCAQNRIRKGRNQSSLHPFNLEVSPPPVLIVIFVFTCRLENGVHIWINSGYMYM